MKVKNLELKEIIIDVARDEFMKKGFKDSSMRVIAKKSNTTLGNLYNYFESKEKLLDEVMVRIIDDIEILFTNHVKENVKINDFELMNRELEKVDLNNMGYNLFLSKEFIILMEGAKGTKYEFYKDEFHLKCKEHFMWHLDNEKNNDNFVEIVVSTFINGVLLIAKRSDNLSKAKDDLIKLYKLICSGMISQFKGGE
ncbi:MAG: TetR/AcrR family transcriptional regulator [Clostridium sp.]